MSKYTLHRTSKIKENNIGKKLMSLSHYLVGKMDGRVGEWVGGWIRAHVICRGGEG
jgi:hypothetical protein